MSNEDLIKGKERVPVKNVRDYTRPIFRSVSSSNSI